MFVCFFGAALVQHVICMICSSGEDPAQHLLWMFVSVLSSVGHIYHALQGGCVGELLDDSICPSRGRI